MPNGITTPKMMPRLVELLAGWSKTFGVVDPVVSPYTTIEDSPTSRPSIELPYFTRLSKAVSWFLGLSGSRITGWSHLQISDNRAFPHINHRNSIGVLSTQIFRQRNQKVLIIEIKVLHGRRQCQTNIQRKPPRTFPTLNIYPSIQLVQTSGVPLQVRQGLMQGSHLTLSAVADTLS